MSRTRLLQLSIAAMGFGVFFLAAACGILAFNYIVAPVPGPLAALVAAMGALAGTAIIVAVGAFALHERRRRSGN